MNFSAFSRGLLTPGPAVHVHEISCSGPGHGRGDHGQPSNSRPRSVQHGSRGLLGGTVTSLSLSVDQAQQRERFFGPSVLGGAGGVPVIDVRCDVKIA